MITAKDILGQNARNLLYIRNYNDRASIKFANSKLRTKQFLEVRDIPVPKLYHVIRNKNDLMSFPWHALPSSFVLKPNAGFGGEGIIVIAEKIDGETFRDVSGNIITLDFLKAHIRDIMDGRFSLGSIADRALFEQLIVNHPDIDKVCYKGLADIRILVFNLVPVMAMMRIPTKNSGGKANVHLGGIGAGIDIGKGTVTHLTQYNRLVREIPGIGNIRGMKIPHWEEMLLISSKIQHLTNLGYLAVDLAVDEHVGPVLLEINARAGLMLQVANMAPLQRRLVRVKGIKIKTPEKGVRVAQDLFGGDIQKSITYVSGKEVLGTEEYIHLHAKEGSVRVLSKVSLSSDKSYIHEKLYKKILMGIPEKDREKGFIKLRMSIMNKKVTTVVYPLHIEEKGVEMYLGARDLKDFLIDPFKYKKGELPSEVEHKKKQEEKAKEQKEEGPKVHPMKDMDRELAYLAGFVKVLKYLKPQNLQQEKEKFFAKNGKYNPKFTYRPLDFDPEELSGQIKKLRFDDSPLGILLEHKRTRLLNEIEFISKVGKKPKEFTAASRVLYGVSEEFYENLAKERLLDRRVDNLDLESPLSAHDVVPIIKETLQRHGLSQWKVQLSETVGSNVAVALSGTVKVRKDGKFNKRGFEGTLKHEIETHVFRGVNGKKQPAQILHSGTADYLETEEGLAIFNQERVLGVKDPKYFSSALSYVRLQYILENSFQDSVQYLLDQEYAPNLQKAFQAVYRVKRGMANTAKAGGCTRDLIYFRGYIKVKQYLEQGGSLKDLYLGKMSVEELPLVKEMEHLIEPELIVFEG